MRFFRKSMATGMLFLSGMAFVASPAQAGWFGKKDDAQTCKTKFENKCQAIEAAKNECDAEFSDFYGLVDKLKSDLQSLKDSQIVSERIFKQLQLAHEAWKNDGFRIDTESYTNYAVLKSKFADENRIIAEQQDLVTSEMKDMLKFISSKEAKQKYVSALDAALEAYYNYSAAAAREALPTVK